MQKYLEKEFAGCEITNKDEINQLYGEANIVNLILKGERLVLPSNLYIWATMNTSDQSLFPIDSAFKRRWDWKYVPIREGRDKETNAPLNWYINTGDKQYKWWSFISKVNELIGSLTNSEDKKLGYFFCKAKDGEIDADLFVSKVIFYLWNDVFKDYGFDDKDFQDEEGKILSFDRFYQDATARLMLILLSLSSSWRIWEWKRLLLIKKRRKLMLPQATTKLKATIIQSTNLMALSRLAKVN